MKTLEKNLSMTFAPMNSVVLQGRSCHDAEIHELKDGGKRITFTLCVEDGARNDYYFLKVERNLKAGEVYQIKKGEPVRVEGQIIVNKYLDRDNLQRFVTIIEADSITHPEFNQS